MKSSKVNVKLKTYTQKVLNNSIAGGFKSYRIEKFYHGLSDVETRKQAKDKVTNSNNRFEKGQIIDYRTPLYSLKSGTAAAQGSRTKIPGVSGLIPQNRSIILGALYKSVKEELEASKHKRKDDFIEFEDKYMQYINSPRSRRVPFKPLGEKIIFDYFTGYMKPNKTMIKIFDKAVDRLKIKIRELIPEGSLKPLDIEEAISVIPKNTNGGAPFFVKGQETTVKPNGQVEILEDNIPLYLAEAKKIINGASFDNYPFINVGRGQESKSLIQGIYNKQRGPWAEAHPGTAIGNIGKPFMDKRAESPTRSALISQLEVDKRVYTIGKQIREHKHKGALGWDGDSYDTHMIPYLAMRIMYEIVVPSFDGTGKELLRIAFEQYIEHMFNSEIIIPWRIVGGGHAMPSGTTGVNELDSMYNEALVEAFNIYNEMFRIPMSLEMIADQGDDAVMILQTPIKSIKSILSVVSSTYKALGQSVNVDKQMLSKNKTEFLKRLHVEEEVSSYRSYIGTGLGMCNMERPKAGDYPMYTARYLMQLANHYNNLPGYAAIMKWAILGDSVMKLGLKLKTVSDVFRLAGGDQSVIKRLQLDKYATHLGVKHNPDKPVINVNELHSVKGLEDNRRTILSSKALSKQQSPVLE